MSVRRNENPMKKRGREARLKREHAHLYPGLDPAAWMPVEDLLRHITELIHQDRAKAKVITGTRLLHQGHFEFRGTSARPDGLPSGATRISDSGLEPSELEAAPGRVSEPGAEPEGGRGGRNS
jgi:hypothetical protein